jgi:type I restriction enzyme R subunit
MAYISPNSEDRLVQKTFAEHLELKLGWESLYAWKNESFGPDGLLGRESKREVVLKRDLRPAIEKLNPELPPKAVESVIHTLTQQVAGRSSLQHNQEFYAYIKKGVPVAYTDTQGRKRETRAQVIDFENGTAPDGSANNRFLAVRELEIQGTLAPHYNRRADLVCFVNGLPLVFIELKAVYVEIRSGFDNNLRDYLEEHSVAHAFHHNAFIIVSNGDEARYGSITSSWDHFNEWKRQKESDEGKLDAEALLNGMLAHDRLLDIVENFILFDASRPGKTRKIVARNHQYLGVNNAVASVEKQEKLKQKYPIDQRYVRKEAVIERTDAAKKLLAAETREADVLKIPQELEKLERDASMQMLEWLEAADPELGKLGVFWHTQGSGKSYSMAFFVEKVRRKISSKFTFLLMTDRDDLDTQIYETFAGCGVADENTPRAKSGNDLREVLKENHRFIFSLIHKFNKEVAPGEPYSTRDDIIVLSDEAHRTQSGTLARNMRMALPNASFIGFTGTPLFKHDEITKRIFGPYVSRYDFKRSEEDGSTVKLVYDNRGEKLKVTRLDLNERIAEAIEAAELNADKEAKLHKLLGKDYEVITADSRLEEIADDFVEHAASRWQSGKALFVCIDKITCARMYQLILPRWEAKTERLKQELEDLREQSNGCSDSAEREMLQERLEKQTGQLEWMESTGIHLIISEAQNELADFREWAFDIKSHRDLIKRGFAAGKGKRVDVETAFKDPEHPFRIGIVCAMWLTGFDVECLSTLYIDKPLRAHTLMQAIARANRRFPGKDFGLIVDYNGMLKSLREALAQYALGDDGNGEGGEEILLPIEERIAALLDALEATEALLSSAGFDPKRLNGLTGFTRIRAFREAVNCLHADQDKKRKFEILAREVTTRYRSLAGEPAAYAYAERHDNIEKISKKLNERRDNSNVTDILKQLHRIVNEAIDEAQDEEAADDANKTYDLSQIDLEKLAEEFEKVPRKASAFKDICDLVEDKLEKMLAANPERMDYYKKYQEIVAEYNNHKDRITIEETFAKVAGIVSDLNEEDKRAVREGLSEDELAIFDLFQKRKVTKVNREQMKQASRKLLKSIKSITSRISQWKAKDTTRAEVETAILDEVYRVLPDPPFNEGDKEQIAEDLYNHIWSKEDRAA